MHPTEIIFRSDGRVYHLDLSSREIARTVILTGDPGRIDHFAGLLDNVEVQRSNREFRSVTGTAQGRRVTFLSTGIGTDNVEIAAIEMDALARQNPALAPFRWIRIGTCGALHDFIRPGSPILSHYAIGLDNLHRYYPLPADKMRWTMESAVKSFFIKKGIPLWPYVVRAASPLSQVLAPLAAHRGITVCAPGFFAPQGRRLFRPHPHEQLPDRLADFEWDNHRILNFEMEVSSLYLLAGWLGHHAAVIDVPIAIRPTGQTLLDYRPVMTGLVRNILDALPNDGI